MSAMTQTTDTVLAVGTRKGLWLARSNDRTDWLLSGPYFLMNEVASVALDSRHSPPRILAGLLSPHWGPTVVMSDDLGETWTEPEAGAITFPPGSGDSLGRIWQLQPDSADRPDVVWAGCEPISVWKSTDGGTSFELNQALWNHPHRPDWGEGYGGAAAHTVLPSPADETVHVAISSGGVYRSDDGGDSWAARNRGISAYFLPDPDPEFGQCVHKVARDAGDPSRLYAQNHHGVYRSDDSGDTWVSIAEGLPADFGFVMLAHPRTSGTVWTIPLVADGERIPPDGELAVYRSTDGGGTWTRLDSGLPQSEYNAVLRDAAALDTSEPVGVYFGTRAGDVYASADEGGTFTLVASNLPDVLCVRAAQLGSPEP